MENINENNGMSIEVINERIENLRNEAITIKRFIEPHEVLLSQMREKLSELEKEVTRLVDERMSAQYKGLKEKHPDAVLLFRCGDFYESYFEDAKDIANILGIVLTHRVSNGMEMAGFPYHALDMYLPKLIRAGRRVAICEDINYKKTTKKK